MTCFEWFGLHVYGEVSYRDSEAVCEGRLHLLPSTQAALIHRDESRCQERPMEAADEDA